MGYVRKLLAIWLLVFCFTSGFSESVQPEADLVLHGGKIVTLDPNHGEQQAIALRGAWIERVGNDLEVSELVGEGTRVTNLDGRVVVPGFIEGQGSPS